jgi:hypothetical protein
VRVPVLTTVAGGLLAAAIALAAPARSIRWTDLPAAVQARLEQSGITSATFDGKIGEIDREARRRGREGDLDHLVFYLLQSTHFTKLPPIEPALSARGRMQRAVDRRKTGPPVPPEIVPPDVDERIGAFLKAVDSSDMDPRLSYFRALLADAARQDRRAFLQTQYVRAMSFIFTKEFASPTPEAVLQLYAKRGLSTDTAVEAGYAVLTGLGVMKGLDPSRRIRRVLIVGPGIDLAPRTGMLDAGPPESYQPWAVIDALVSLGLSGLDDLEVVGADINPRVVAHLRAARQAPPLLRLVSGIGESASLKFAPGYREYFTTLGRAVGSERGGRRAPEGHLSKTVAVGAKAAATLRAEPLNVVTERLEGEPFDLVIATNILPYFANTELTLALSNIAGMLAAGGVFLHNDTRTVVMEAAAAAGLEGQQSRQVTIASVTAAPPLADTIVVHRKASADPGPGFSFTNVARQAGLTARTVYGNPRTNKYLIETTGTGAAAIDFDADGWMDIFLVNGTTLDGFPKGQEPTNHLYRNRGDGTFEDVTARAGLAASGWGQAACVGDYDNDGRDDLFVTYWGQNRLYRNAGNGTFDDVTNRAGLWQDRRRWNTGCAFLDYDRDGRLDLLAANYIDLDLATTPLPSSGLCRYKGLAVACGPPGLPGGKNVLYRNRGDGTFADVSDASGIARAKGTYGLGVTTLDFDADGWVDVYVANDSSPSALYRNNRDGTFTDIGTTAGCAYSQDGKAQAGMGLAVGDYDRNGTMDVFKTNFAGDTSTLYANTGDGLCEDRTFTSGIGVNTRWLGWGVGFLDLDADGWLDLFLVNGHVYPEVAALETEAGYAQPKVVYRNLANGRFADVSAQLGPPVTTLKAGRGAVFADFDNDGDVDVLVNNMHDTPDLFRLDRPAARPWISLKLIGTRSNRNAIGALVRVVTSEGAHLRQGSGGQEQRQEVRGGGSYYSQNDFRLHFGLGNARTVDRIVVRWPTGLEESWPALATGRLHTLTEGTGHPERVVEFGGAPTTIRHKE